MLTKRPSKFWIEYWQEDYSINISNDQHIHNKTGEMLLV